MVLFSFRDASGRIELEVVASEDVQDTKNQASNFLGGKTNFVLA